MGYYVGGGGWLRKEEEKSEDTETKKNGNGNGANGNGNGNGGSDGGSNGGGVSEAWSAKYKKSIDCDNPKGFSQRAHCQGRKKVNEATMSSAQKRKDTMLKKKYDKSDMKQNMIDQYGKEEGTKIYFATIRKQAMKEEKKGDHEISMAQSQLKKSERNIKKLRKALGTKERDIPAWVQAKITDTEHNTDAAAGYMEEGKRDGKSAKDKGYSLRDWFKGGGWVQAGGKYDGKPCAKQPGQKTKPYCRDADDRASMSKEERNKRARKKRKEDPNPNRKGKAKNVTQESYSNWRADLDQLDELAPAVALGIKAGLAAGTALAGKAVYDKGKKVAEKIKQQNQQKTDMINRTLGNSYEPEGDMVDEGKKDACYHKVKSRYSVWPSAYASGALVKCRKVGAKNWGNKTKKEGFSDWREDMLLEGLEDKLRKMSPEQIEDLIKANKGAEQKIRDAIKNMRTTKSQGPGVQLPNIPKQPASTSSATPRETYQRGGSDRTSYQRRPRPARPSAPKAKVGIAKKVLNTLSKAKNPRVAAMLGLGALSAGMFAAGMRGIKKQQQNEGYDVSNWKDDFQAMEIESIDIIKPEPLQPSQSVIDEAGKKCWKGYKKAGTQKLFGKTYNRCVKAHFSDWRADMDLQEKESKPDYLDFDGDGNKEESMKKALKDKKKVKKEEVELQEAIPGYEKYNAAVAAASKLTGRKKIDALKAAALLRPKTEKEVNQKLGEDWQKSNRNDGVDGMSQKSVNAYKRENPGSKLQTAVTEKKPTGKRAKRRTSFCARSKGQKDMHNIDCTKTPEKKICKARKRWRC